MKLNFNESTSLLNGKILKATASIQQQNIQFNIIPDIFCRDWHEVSYLINDEKIILGRYVSKIEEAKLLCETKYQELLQA